MTGEKGPLRRYRLIHSYSLGGFSEFSATSDEEAVEQARNSIRYCPGARIVSLVQIEHWASGDVTRPVEVPE